MKAVVFGGTGFIGGHVVEQLQAAGHRVTAAVRETSQTAFLESLGVHVVQTDFSDPAAIEKVMKGQDAAYNCTADAKLDKQIGLDAPVEISLTRLLTEAAAAQGVSRFIQLSSIVIYDFRSNASMDESYPVQPEFPIQLVGLERERIVLETGRKTGMTSMILRPASTIGVRDFSSFFARMFAAHANDQYPLVGGGTAEVSLVDTRDIGRAMVWLGTYEKPEKDNGIYLLKGFDTTWYQLKKEIDRAAGRISKTMDLPHGLTDEQMMGRSLNSFAYRTLSVNRLWNDSKIRRLGFETCFSLKEAVDASVTDIMSRRS